MTAWGVAENVRAAERIGLLVALAGAMPLIPHANTAHFHGIQADEYWLEGTLELLRRCDGGVFLPKWRQSSGSVGEFRVAGSLSIPRLALDDFPESAYQREITNFVEWVSRGQVHQAEERRDAGQTAAD